MGLISKPLPGKLFVGILTSVDSLLPRTEAGLTALFGPSDLRAGPFPFDATTYYDEEMGSPVSRYFLGFSRLISPENLADIKEETNELEAAIAAETPSVRRPVNLDPGYLEQAKIVLASTKNFYHRILISGGIYAEVTQHYEDGQWRSLPWTFPDFRSGRYSEFFLSLRRTYRAQLKAGGDRDLQAPR